MTSGNFLKRKEWEYSGGLSKHKVGTVEKAKSLSDL